MTLVNDSAEADLSKLMMYCHCVWERPLAYVGYKYWLGYKGICKSNKTVQRSFCLSPVLQFCVWVFLGWFGWFFYLISFCLFAVFLKVECLVFSRANPELLLVILFPNMAWSWLSQDCICKRKCAVLVFKSSLGLLSLRGFCLQWIFYCSFGRWTEIIKCSWCQEPLLEISFSVSTVWSGRCVCTPQILRFTQTHTTPQI